MKIFLVCFYFAFTIQLRTRNLIGSPTAIRSNAIDQDLPDVHEHAPLSDNNLQNQGQLIQNSQSTTDQNLANQQDISKRPSHQQLIGDLPALIHEQALLSDNILQNPQSLTDQKLANERDILKRPSHQQLLGDLPTLNEIIGQENINTPIDPFFQYPTPMSLLPTIHLAEAPIFTTKNAAFDLGDPVFINQYPSLNMLNPSVTMSLLSPYMNYMNQNSINPMLMNPYMLNPYFAPGFVKKAQKKNPETITGSHNANRPSKIPETIHQSEHDHTENEMRKKLKI